ncbi:Na(+)-translocating NADH-quinone reductase subunit F [Pseudofulvibacter geojedonensis]|uniref:Na(+)-translocating NADH-quinone reductase subunit F n=1 Tax=Pseudofulvibacter geojedonensis TaxID=1123758 RepID=A0ABW3I183_9FLAO
MGKALNTQELHNLAMNIVGADLEKKGFEFVAINSKLKKHPQYVCIDKEGQYYFVIVRATLLPEDPDNYDVVWMETFRKHARDKDAKVLYAGVGLGNPNVTGDPVYLDQPYLLQYEGILDMDVDLN